ncbi:hypothetical protein FACS1894198_6350 [Clostridia bacterium]|nr:hypothetical protein FACS1894198_6350 [Clostridia bacterium]
MNKEKLAKLGLSEEQINLIMGDFEGNFIPKARFNEVNNELKQLKESLKERDSQLEELKSNAADSNALKAQIDELINTNKAKEQEYEAKFKGVKLDSIVASELMKAKAKNITATKALLSDFLSDAELEGDTIKGLDKQIKSLIEADDTKFLFDIKESENKGILKGFTPSERKDGTPNTGKPQTLSEAIRMQIGNN